MWMMALQLKIGLAAVLPTALAGACEILALLEPGSDSLRLWRLSLIWGAIACALCLTIWALDRARRAEARAAALERALTELAEDASHAHKEVAKVAKVKRRVCELERRLEAVENDMVGRQLARQLWSKDELDEFNNRWEDRDAG
jgi:hypothetical protein